MTTQWGPPLTGAQMELLRAAGLQNGTKYQFEGEGDWIDCSTNPLWKHFHERYRLPADHPAYTLLQAGWLDGRNVRLWSGGDKAPNDWDSTTAVLLASGFTLFGDSNPDGGFDWRHGLGRGNIIAYIAKDEITPEQALETRDKANAWVSSALNHQPETVTIAKMTEAEARRRFDGHFHYVEVLQTLSLIKPEPTREERFWALHEPEGATIPTHIKKWVRDALEFER